MKYLPYEDFEIQTSLSPDEIFHRFRAAVDTKRKWWIFTNKPFWGEVNRHYLLIWPVGSFFKAKDTIVFGTIVGNDVGCQVRVRMRFYFRSLIFWFLVLGMFWSFCFGTIASLILAKIQTGLWDIGSSIWFFPSMGIFVFGYLFVMISFKSSTTSIKMHLEEITETKMKNFHHFDRLFGLTEFKIVSALFLGTLLISGVWILYQLTIIGTNVPF